MRNSGLRKKFLCSRWRESYRFQLAVVAALTPGLTFFAVPIQANPSGGVVVHGDIHIGPGTGGNLQINQNSTNAIINWDDFSIAAGELTQFNQPGINSAVLNRVMGGNPSEIHGALRANGSVFVINPNGILVGANGTIDVHGLVLSTLDVSDGEFLAGGDMVFKGKGEGVTNLGRINAIGGDVFLIGKTVTNSGSIKAGGTVGLGAGEEILLKAESNAFGERMFVRATGAGASGTGVLNDGSIEGAAIELKAHGNIYALAINNKGSVRAIGATNSGGRVFLKGVGGTVSNTGSIRASAPGIGSGGRVLIEAAYARVDGMIAAERGKVEVAASREALLSGEIDVSSTTGRGGELVVEARDILMTGDSRVDASGATGGGVVQIGGGFQGRSAEIQNANSLRVEAGAEFNADATDSGNGGVVILWSDDSTSFAGAISARGVGALGNGGFAEVSGKETLGYTGMVDLSSDHGLSGTLLLDPTNITISSAADAVDNVNNVNLSNTLDAGTNVIITSNFGAAGPRGDITVNERVEWYQDTAGTPGGTLSLLAMGDVIINDSVRSAGAGGVNIVAGWDGSTGIVDPLSGAVETTPGAFNMQAVLDTMPGGASEGSADAAGLGNGSVRIGSNTADVQINVGSRFGDTLVAAHDLFMTGDGNTNEAYVQLGFADNGTEYQISNANQNIDGTGVGNGINNGLRNEWWGSFSAADGSGTGFTVTDAVTGKDYIALLGGTPDSTAGVGSFLGAGSGANGDITVRLSGRLDMQAGTTLSYVQIGHGGSGQEGFEQGARSTGETRTTRDGYILDTTSARTFFSTTWRTNTEVDPLNGSLYRVNGDITVQAAGDIQMLASTGITTDPNSVANTNAGAGNYAMIGHGGAENPGSYHGDVTVIAEGAVGDGLQGDLSSASRLAGIGIDMIGGRADTRFVQIGHGSTREGNPRSIFDMQRSGDITVTAETGAIRMQGYTQLDNRADQYSQVHIGHGGSQADAPANNGIFSGGVANFNITGLRPDNSAVGDVIVLANGYYVDPNDATSRIGISARAGNQLYSYAQIGHGGANQRADTGVGYQGDVIVTAPQGDILFAGGADKASNRDWGYGRNHAMIGHGGRDVEGAKGGLVTVEAGQGAGATDGDIRFFAGKHYESFAQIGHGGFSSIGDYGSTTGALTNVDNDSAITVTAFGDIHFESGESGSANALGVAAYANTWFNELPPVGSRTSNGFYNVNDRYVMIGHGGRAATGVMANAHDITVTSGTGDLANADGDVTTGGIKFIAGNQNFDFAQIGHGGHASGANNDDGYSGDIMITANGGGVVFDGSLAGGTRYVRSNRTFNGTTNTVTVHAIDGGEQAYVQIGHGGYAARGRHSGELTVTSYGGIDMLGSVNNPITSESFNSATDDLSSVQNSLNAGANLWTSLAPRVATAATTANAFTVSSGRVNLAPGTLRIVLDDGTVISDLPDADNDEQNGDTGSVLVNQNGTVVGNVHYRQGLVRFNTVVAGNVVTVDYDSVQGYKELAYAQIGHGGFDSDGPNNNRTSGGNSGTITLTVADDIRVHAGAFHRAYAQIGHGGLDVRGAHSGNIIIDIVAGADGGKLEMLAGVGGARHRDYQAYAQLGHGGFTANGNHYGDITITNGRNEADGIGVLFKAGTNQDNYTQLGHGGRGSRSGENLDALGTGSFGLNGDIVIQTKGDVAFVAGTGIRNNEAWRDDFRNYAQLGHGGWDADPEQSNDNNFGVTNALFTRTAIGDTTAGEAGVGAGRWGHFGDIVINTIQGDISFMAGNTIALADRLDPEGNIGPITGPDYLVSHGDGVGRFHSSMLGHGGIVTSGDHHGSISVVTGNGSVNVAGGMYSDDDDVRLSNFAQIGHTYQYHDGGPNGHLGRSDESIEVMALGVNGNINLVAGNGQSNSAKIGLGGRETDGTFLGDIRVYAGNDINLMGGVALQREVTRIAEFQDMSGANGGNANDLSEFNNYWGNTTTGPGYVMMDEAAGAGGGQKSRFMSDDVTPGSVEFRIADTTHAYDGTASADIIDVDNGDGTGNLVAQVDLANGNALAGDVVGTIDYATSEVTWNVAVIANAGDEADLFVNYNTTTHISNDAINSFAQIGHGGLDATPLANVHPETGAGDQLGHVGNIDVRAGVDALGNYTVTRGAITGLAGNDRRNFVQIGHGGVSSIAPTDGFFSGTINVRADGGIRFRGGETLQDDFTVAWNYDPSQPASANNVRVTGVPGGTDNRGLIAMEYNYAMIGHGGVNSDADNSLDNNNADPLSTREGHNGDIFVQANNGDIKFEAGGGRGYGHFTQIGHGGLNGHGNHHGNIDVEALNGSIEFIGGGQTYDGNNADHRAYSMIGHGGHGMTGNLGRIGEHINVTAAGMIDFHGTPKNNLGAAVPYAAHVYTLNRPNNQDENHRNRARGDENFTMIGHGGSFVYGDKTAEINVTAGGGISFSGAVQDAGGEDGESDNAGSYNFAQIGHGGYSSYRQYRSNLVPGSLNHADEFNVPSNLDGTGLPFWPMDNSINAALGLGVPLYDGFSGDVTVLATGGDITFTGGNAHNTFARIGHGGYETAGDHEGVIDVRATAGSILFNADVDLHGTNAGFAGSGNNTFTQIGHGGYYSDGEIRSDIFVSAHGDLDFNGGDSNSFAMIGHGGWADGGTVPERWGGANAAHRRGNDRGYRPATRSGNIEVESGGDILFTAGNNDGELGFAQIGHGGRQVAANPWGSAYGDGHSGQIDVTAGGEIVFEGGSRRGDYVMIGHGGYETFGNHGGDGVSDNRLDSDITVEGGDGITFKATGISNTNTARNFAQIGHGGWRSSFRDVQDMDGENFAILGPYDNGGLIANNLGRNPWEPYTTNPDGLALNFLTGRPINEVDAGNENFITPTGTVSAGAATIGTFMGDITVRTTNAGANIRFLAPSEEEGTIYGNAGESHAMIGHGGFRVFGDIVGDITVESAGGIDFHAVQGDGTRASNHQGAFAMLGHGGYESGGEFSGDIIVSSVDSVSFIGGNSVDGANQGFVQLGHGGFNSDDDHAQILDALRDANGNRPATNDDIGNSGNITVTVSSGDLEFLAGKDADTYAQLGHGGRSTSDTHHGDILVNVSGGIRFIAGVDASIGDTNPGGNERSYVQIGHGGNDSDGSHYGDIEVNAGAFASGPEAGKGIVFRSGDHVNNSSQIGHGGHASRTYGTVAGGGEGLKGDITVTAAGDIHFVAGSTFKGGNPFDVGNEGQNYTQIGHGGYNVDSYRDPDRQLAAGLEGHSGDIKVITTAGNITFLSAQSGYDVTSGDGGGSSHYAQLGHGGSNAQGDHHGNIEVRAGIDENGTVLDATSQILFAAGGGSLDEWADNNNYAQLGHGGRMDGNTASSAGNFGLATEIISVSSGGDITFTTAGGVNNYVQLGNGGYNARGNHSGDIQVLANGNVLIEGSQMKADGSTGSYGAAYAFQRPQADNNSYLNLDRAAEFLATTQGTARAAGVADFVFNQAQIGTLRVIIRNDAGNIVMTLHDPNSDGNLVVESVDAGITNVDPVAVGDTVGTYTASRIQFNRDVNPGSNAYGGTSNIGLLYESTMTDRAYAMVGHGGYDADLPNNDAADRAYVGDISIVARTGNVTINSGHDDDTFAMVGHGSRSTFGVIGGTLPDESANIFIRAGGAFAANAGDGARANARVGHGGYDSDGDKSGHIKVSAGSGALFTSLGTGVFNDVFDFDLDGIKDNVTFTTLDPTLGTITLNGGSGREDSEVHIGHGGNRSQGVGSGLYTGDIGVSATGDITLLGGAGSRRFAQIGHGGWDDASNASNPALIRAVDVVGGISVISEGGDMILKAAPNSAAYALIGHGSDADSNLNNIGGSREGRVFVLADTITLDRSGSRAAWIGHEFERTDDNQNPFAAVNLEMTNLEVGSSYVAAGYQVIARNGLFSANNGVANTNNNITITDNLRDNFIRPNMAFGDFTYSGGTITVNSLLDGTTLFDATNRSNNFSLLAAGDIDVNFSIQNPGTGDINLIAGAQFGSGVFSGPGSIIDFPSIGTDNFQQIDHLFCPPVGSLNMVAVNSGDTFGFNGGSVIIDAIPRAIAVGSRGGTTTVAGHSVQVLGGNNTNEYSQIGFRSVNEVDDGGNADLAGAATGDVMVRAADGGVRVEAGTGLRTIAQIGHGGDDSTLGALNDITDPSHSGMISVDASFGGGGNVTVFAGNGNQRWAMIGHGGRSIAAGQAGDILVRGVDITLAGGGSDVAHTDSSAQIGHGGRASSGTSSGAITVEATGNLAVRSGDGVRAVSMIGHGGRSAPGSHEGEIRITAAGTFDLIAGGAEDSFAQVGHGGYGSRGDQEGNIYVLVGGNITAESGSGSRAYVQIGQGGYEADDPNNAGAGTPGVVGEIEVASTGGSIAFTAGSGANAYAQLGHGGISNQGDHSGAVTVRAREDITFSSGGGNNGYSQLGHGGNGAFGNHTGSIFVSAGTSGDFLIGGNTASFGAAATTGAISFTAGNALQAYTQLGHGGLTARGDHGVLGDVIDVRAASGISFSGGAGLLEGQSQRLAYAMLGHGGHDADNPNPGNYADNTAGTPGFPTAADRVGNTADITVVTAGGDISFAAGSQDRNFAQLGHGGHSTDGDHTGTITVEATDGSILFESLLDGVDVNLASGSDNPDERYVMLGHGGYFASGSHTGDIDVTAGVGGDIRFTGGANGSSFAQLGHGGRNDYRQSGTGSPSGNNVNDSYYPGTLSGNIAVTAGLDISFTGGNGGSVGYAQLGHGGFRSAAITGEGHEGQIDVTSTGGAINFTAGTAGNAFVQIGHGGSGSMGNHGRFDANGSGGVESDITVSGATGVNFTGGGASSYAQIGHGGLGASFDPTIVPAPEPSGSAGFHLNTPVTTPLGSAGEIQVFAGFAADGTTQLSAGANATFHAGTAGSSFAQVGHGGVSTSGNHEGAITLRSTGAFELETLTGSTDAYAQLGHGGRLARGSHTGDIVLSTENDITLASGNATRVYTQIGHGGNDADDVGGLNDGTISVTSHAGSLSMTAGGSSSSAQIGHGGVNTSTRSGTSVLSAAIDIGIAGNGSLVSGNGDNAYAQIGHGGTNARIVNQLGDICVHVGGTWMLDAATNDSAGVNSYVQIGHGGQNADGNHAGDVTVVSGFTNGGGVTMLGGDTNGRFVQIGHGSGTIGRNMNLAGDIFVVANNGGDLVMTGGGGTGSYAMAGHGDGFGTYMSFDSGITSGTREGGLQYFVDGDAILNSGAGTNSNVHLIHRTNTSGGLSAATYLGGDSYRYIVNGSTLGNDAASGSRENQGVIINGIAGTGDIFITDNTGADVNVGIPGNPADQFTNDGFSFVVLATGNINFQRSVQNAGDGLIALVAGWNGVQDASTIDFNNGVCHPEITPGAIDFDDKTAWGNTFAETGNPIHTEGRLMIGNATQTEAVMVGSRSGSTVLRGYEIELISSNTTADAFTQVGFHNPTTDITGPGPINYRPSIDVQARAGGLTLTSGSAAGAFTQIGHGGTGSAAGVNIGAEIFISFCDPADVTLHAGGLAGSNGTYAQIGHGISNLTGSRGGDISLLNVANVSLNATPAGQNDAYAQIGHGGTNDDGTKSGEIVLTGAVDAADQGDVSLLSNAIGAGSGNFLQIGHGGNDADGDATAGVTLTNFRDVTLHGGDSIFSHAQIGHGGRAGDGVQTGAVSITASRDITLLSGDGEDSFAQIGHGGASHSGNLFGAVTVHTGGDILLSGGLGENAFTQIGLGGNGGSGTKQGLVNVTSTGGGLTMNGGNSTTAANSFAFIGNGGHAETGVITLSDTTVDVAGAIDMNGGAALRSYVQIGAAGQGTNGNHDSNVSVTAGGDISLDAGSGNTAYAQIGMGGQAADGTMNGDTTVVSTGGGVSVTGGSGANAAAKIGNGGANADGNMTGFIDVTADTFIRVAGAADTAGTGGFAMIGHGGITYTGDLGDADDYIRLNAGTSVEVLGGGKDNSFAMVGHGGLNNTSSPTYRSAIEVTAGTDVTVRGGASTTTDDAYAMIGHGGAQMTSTANDTIRVDARNGTLTIAAGGGINATANFAQVGHGGHGVEGAQGGDIIVLANAIDMESGTTAESYAQIGHGGFEDDGNADGSLSGNIFVNFDPTANGGAGAVVGGNGDISLNSSGGSASADAFTQIGHGGPDREGTITGNILIGKAANVELLGGGTRAYAQIGHGGAASAGFSAPVSKSGDITLLETASITLTAGTGSDSYVQIGHGGNENGGEVTGNISLATDGTLAVNGGTNTDAYAQVGHGGHGSNGTISNAAEAIVIAANAIELNAGTGGAGGGYSQIGHGGFTTDGAFAGAIVINFNTTTNQPIPVGGALTLNGGGSDNAYAQIGHGGANDNGDISTKDGNILVGGFNAVTVSGGTGGADSYAQIGHGGDDSDGNITGSVDVVSTGAIAVNGGTGGSDAYAQIGHGGQTSDGIIGAVTDATIVIGEGIALSGGNGTRNYAQIGFGGFDADGTINGQTFVNFDPINGVPAGGGAVTLDGGSGRAAYAQIGLGGIDSDAAKTGDVRVEGDSVSVRAGSGMEASASIGSGGGINQDGGNNFASGVITSNTIVNAAVGGVEVDASAGGVQAFAQIGAGGLLHSETTHTGTTAVTAAGDVTLTGGDNSNTYAQIGLGGAGIDAAISNADVTVSGNNIVLTGGIGAAGYALIGAGGGASGAGNAVNSTVEADVTVTAVNAITMTAGSGPNPTENRNFAQIGLGSNASTGEVTVEAGTDLVMAAGGDTSHVKIGHGTTTGSGAANSGDIHVGAGGGFSLNSGSGVSAFAQIGHGIAGINGTGSGNIFVHVDGAALGASAAAASGGYSLIGHGGSGVTANQTGSVTLVSAGGIDLTGGSSAASFAQIGHAAVGDLTGSVAVVGGDDITLGGGGSADSGAMIGHGSTDNAATGARTGGLHVYTDGAVVMSDGAAGPALISHQTADGMGSVDFSGAEGGDSGYSIVALSGLDLGSGLAQQTGAGGGLTLHDMIGKGLEVGDVTIASGGSTQDLTIGSGAQNLSYNSVNALSLLSGGDLTINGSILNAGSGSIGLLAGWTNTGFTSATAPTMTGPHDLAAPVLGNLALPDFAPILISGPVAATEFGADNGIVRIGDGTQTLGISVGSKAGVTEVLGSGIALTGGAANGAHAQLGYFGDNAGTMTGDLNLSAKSDGISAAAGAGDQSFAQVGHGGGSSAGGNVIADINIRQLEPGSLNLAGSDGTGAYAQIGHGGANYRGIMNGAITPVGSFTQAILAGGSGDAANAQFGHGGVAADGAKGGDISLSAAVVLMEAGEGEAASAQIGHGGRNGDGSVTGSVTVEATAGAIEMVAGDVGQAAAVQIGHGGGAYNGNVLDEDITVTAAGPIAMIGGDSDASTVMIGHGGMNAVAGQLSGDINVTSNDVISVGAGVGRFSFAQIGNGGALVSNTLAGDIAVISTGGNVLVGGNDPANGSYAKVGHGDDLRGMFAPIAGSGSREGDITISSVDDIRLNTALVGHVNDLASPVTTPVDPASGVVLVVSSDDFTDPAGGSLIMDAEAQIYGAEDVRVYLPGRASNRIAAGAIINGHSWAGAPADPSATQRDDEFTRFITGTNPSSPLEHNFNAAADRAPTNAAAFAFYYKVIGLNAPVVLPPDGGGDGGNDGTGGIGGGTNPIPPIGGNGFSLLEGSSAGSDFVQVLVSFFGSDAFEPDDRSTDDWQREDQSFNNGFDAPGTFFFEGVDNNGPSGDAIYNFLTANGFNTDETLNVVVDDVLPQQQQQQSIEEEEEEEEGSAAAAQQEATDESGEPLALLR